MTVGLLAGALALSGVGLALPAQGAVSTSAKVLINEVYGGGGNSGAVLRNDFVELVNVSNETVDLSGWSLQYASASGTSWNNKHDLSGSIQPGGTFLVQEASGGAVGAVLPAPDASGSINLSGTNGKLALTNTTTQLTGNGGAHTAASVVDFVGYGSADEFAGSATGGTAAPVASATNSVSRTDRKNTANNGADFVAGPPTPENSSASTPDPDPSGSPTTSPSPTSSPTAPVQVAIDAIQGTGDASPLVGQTVTTEGVVTARYPDFGNQSGYIVQTAGTGGALDAGHTASDAIFVSSGATVGSVAVGDSVRLTGTVAEQFTVTRLNVAAGGVEKLSTALPAPTAATVAWPADAAGRERIESMLVQPQGTFTVSDTYSTNQYGEVGLAAGTTPLRQPTDAADAGSADAAAVAADNLARGVVLDDGASTDFLNTAQSTKTPPYVSLTEPVVVGGTATFTKPVIVHYDFNVWRFLPTEQVVGDGTGATDGVTFSNPRTPAPAEVGGDLSIASFNVLNYFTTLGENTAGCEWFEPIRNGQKNSVAGGCSPRGAWDAADLKRQQDKIVAAIDGLDASVVGLMEIENSAKVDGEAATDEATATLVAALNAAAGAGTWAYVPSSEELPDPSQQDVIANAIIYQPALVTPVGASRALGTESAAGGAFDQAREPIAQVFAPADGGEEFLFVVNHFKSKGSAATTRPGDQEASSNGQGASNLTRVEQAEALDEWVDSIKGDTEAVALVGDFNSYGQEDPLQVLYESGYSDAETAFELGKSSYSFDGLAGSLDHVLLNDAARERATGADIWNINSGESIALEYSRYRYHGTDFYKNDVYRSSDHDPVKVGMTAEGAAPVELTLLGINDFHGRITPVTPPKPASGTTPAAPENSGTVGFAGTVEQLRAEAGGDAVFLSAGDNIGASLFASSIQQDQPTIDVLNTLGLQTSAVGNHEFDKGFADLTGRVSTEADFSYLGANVYQKGTQTPALQEYELIESEGITIGVIGTVTEETASLVSPGGIDSIEFGDPVAATNRVAAQLTDGNAANGEADVLVALYHEGAGSVAEDATLDDLLADGGAFAEIVNETTAEVDAIFTGHTHQEYAFSAPIPGTDRTRPLIQTGSYGANIGKVTLEVDPESLEVIAHTETNVPVSTAPAAELIATYPVVAEVDAIVREAIAYAQEIGNEKVGEVASDITTAFSGGSFVNGVWAGGSRDNRAAESTLGNLVAESIRETLSDLPNGAQIGVTNSGGLRAELYDTQAEFGNTAVPGLADGDISFSQALAVLPFNNTMGLTTLTGAQFKAVLEQQWQRLPDGTVPSRSYLQLGLSDNVDYTYDASRPEGDRITSITVDGEFVVADEEYRVGTLSFLAQGGDNFRAFAEGADYVDTGLVDYEGWVNYLRDQSAEEPIAPKFAKHAVEVTGQTTVPAGSNATFTVSNLNLTSRGTPETTELQVWLGPTQVGTVPVTGGSAQITVPIPATAQVGEVGDVVLVSEIAGTEVTVPITVGDSAPEPPTDGEPGEGADNGSWATVTLGSDRVEQGGTLRVTVTGLEPGQRISATLFSDPIVATGIPAADASGRTSFSIAIPANFDLGAHTLVVTTAGEDPIRVGLTVVARGALAVTGAEFPLGLALGGAALLVALGVMMTMRRRSVIRN